MKYTNHTRVWLLRAAVAGLLMLALCVGVLAYPGDGGNPNLSNGSDDTIDGQTVLTYTTVEPVGTSYRPGGEVIRTSGTGTSQVYKAEPNDGWVFSHWVTYYQGTSVKEANPKYAYGLGDNYYFSVPGDMDTAFVKTSPTIQINNEWDATGVYYLYAIFRPVVKLEADTSSTVSFANDTTSFSGVGKVEGNLLSGSSTKANFALGARVLEQVKLNGTATTAYTLKQEMNGWWVYVPLEDVTGPVTVTLTSRPMTCKVAFDANGGTGTMEAQSFTAATQQKLTKNTLTRTGWEFAGWNTKADGTGTAYPDEQAVTLTPASDGETITLYAQWKHLDHTGGTATCQSRAVCATCGQSYGDVSTSHTWGNWTSGEVGTHSRTCTVEGCTESQSGTCNGGTATCQSKPVCAACGEYYGEVSTSHTWSKWTTNADGTHSRACTVDGCTQTQKGNCAGGTATCAKKAVCATCGGEYGNLKTTHTWGKWTPGKNNTHTRTCSVEGCTQTQSANCAGGTATCAKKAVCSTCGGEYGNLKTTHTWGKWTSNKNGTHTRTCSVTGCTKTQTANCAGGTATCAKKAVCSTCSGEYGNTKAHTYNRNHLCTACGAKDPKYANPDTADHGMPLLWLSLMLLSGGTAAALLVQRKRQR